MGHRRVTIGGWGRVVDGRAGETTDRATTTLRRVGARANERCRRVASRSSKGFVASKGSVAFVDASNRARVEIRARG